MLNIVIPMAGRGSRFQDAGFTLPKPLIDVHGRPMITRVIENLRPSRPHRFTFVCQHEHLRDHHLGDVLRSQAPGCQVMGIRRVTAGAACTVLLATEHIDNNDPLMIANCDQYVDTSIDQYLAAFDRDGSDGFIMTMRDSDPKWSYVQRNHDASIVGVVEKEVVSNEATVGIYNFARGRDFVRYAQSMIAEDRRSKNEFYVAPVYSDMVKSGCRIGTADIGPAGDRMHGLGTPGDLSTFLMNDKLRRTMIASAAAA